MLILADVAPVNDGPTWAHILTIGGLCLTVMGIFLAWIWNKISDTEKSQKADTRMLSDKMDADKTAITTLLTTTYIQKGELQAETRSITVAITGLTSQIASFVEMMKDTSRRIDDNNKSVFDRINGVENKVTQQGQDISALEATCKATHQK